MKKILDSKGIINKILSGTQRKTPTVVHKRFPIERIRRFYIKKIKYVQQNFSNQITEILDNFPSIDYIHPFFGDLLNLMFERQHYKIALAKISVSKRKINYICKNFVKIVKNGNTSYVCKQSKKEALGRICTVVKKLNKSFVFLEKVRKHLDNLPNLDPYRKIIVLHGSSKVGKSSFLNKTTRANVKLGDHNRNNNFILIGHMQSNFSQLQILDVTGTFTQSICKENRFIMKVYSIFLNLDCINLHFLDLSECFSSSFNTQIKIFKSLWDTSNVIIKLPVFTKTDLGWEKFLNLKQKAGVNFLLKTINLKRNILKTSFHDEIGLYSVKKEIYQTIFSSQTHEGNKGNKIKFFNSSFKKLNKKSSFENIKFQSRCLDREIIPSEKSTQRTEKNFSETPTNPFFMKKNCQTNILKKQKDAYKNLANSLDEREQKNREINIEKFFIRKRLNFISVIKRSPKNCIFESKNNTKF
jgi:nucleolar GTP-binding protein